MVTGDGGCSGMVISSSVTASMSKPRLQASRACCSIVSTTLARPASSSPAARQHGIGYGARQSRQNRLQAADHGLEQADAVSERPVNVGFDRALVVQIDDPNAPMLLAETIDTADVLFHPHGVPRHVVVDQGAAELEVQALCGGFRTQQDIGLAVAEPPFGIVAADPAPGAVGGGYFSTASREAHRLQTGVLQEFSAQKIHGVGVLGEDHHLAVAVLAQFVEGALQAFELAVRRQLTDAAKEALDVGLLFDGEGRSLKSLAVSSFVIARTLYSRSLDANPLTKAEIIQNLLQFRLHVPCKL